jgi:hypothetical protein
VFSVTIHILTLFAEQKLSQYDEDICRGWAFKLKANIPDRIWAFVDRAFPRRGQEALPKTDAQRSRIAFLAGIQPQVYDCCPDSCLCYTGPHAELTQCPYCDKSRRTSKGKARKTFSYIPLAPRLAQFAANLRMAKLMQYRGEYKQKHGSTADIFDSEEYQKLCKELIEVDDVKLTAKYFSDNRDVAMGISSDGFGPFKSRKITCWPLLVFNYNLPPDIRFHLEFMLSVGVIPGPKKPKDFDSFLWPLVQEFKMLAHGIVTFDGLKQEMFRMRAFPIAVFGDIPAVSMITRMKGHNGYCPCRICTIKGITTPADDRNHTHYVPLDRSNHPDVVADPVAVRTYNPLNLPLRTHEQFMEQADEVDAATTNTAADKLSMKYGIKGRPLLAQLHSLRFPTSFPYDFMHLIDENLLINLIKLWTGNFKGLDDGEEEYELDNAIWKAVGEATHRAGDTIPSAYGARVPNLAADGIRVSAEMYSFWALYLGPVLLRRKFTHQKYFKHFVELVRLLNLCLLFEITNDQINDLEESMAKWVQQYEKCAEVRFCCSYC